MDGVAQLLLLLPDLTPSTSSGSLHPFASGELLLSGSQADVQQVVLVSLDLLQRLLGSDLLKAAPERALQLIQQQQQQEGLPAGSHAASAVGDGAGSIGRLCLTGLLAAEKLGFPASEGGAP